MALFHQETGLSQEHRKNVSDSTVFPTVPGQEMYRSRACRKLQSPPNSPPSHGTRIASYGTRIECRAVGFLSTEQNGWPHLTRIFSLHSCLIWVSKGQAVQALGPVLLPHQDCEDSETHLLLSREPSSGCIGNLTRESRQQ